MTRLAYAALAGSMLFASGAQAQDDPRFYAGVFTGSNSPEQQTLFGRNQLDQLRDIKIDYESDALAGANLGLVAVDHGWGRARFEVEFSQRESSVEALSLNDVDRVVEDGSESSVTAGMINAWYDSPRYFDRVRFSLGAGFGLAGVDNEIQYDVANPAATGGNAEIALPASEVTYAYQLMAGVEVELNRSWSLVADVRRFELGDYQAERYILNTPGVGAGRNGTLDSILDADWSATSVSAGLRFKF